MFYEKDSSQMRKKHMILFPSLAPGKQAFVGGVLSFSRERNIPLRLFYGNQGLEWISESVNITELGHKRNSVSPLKLLSSPCSRI